MDSDQSDHWVRLAEREWPKETGKARRVRAEIVENEIWSPLEKQQFDPRSLQQLENLQLLENYLWPGFDEEESSHHHVLLVVLMTIAKMREDLPAWSIFKSNSDSFSPLFRRTLSLSLDDSIQVGLRTHILSFLICAFQSLDEGFLRKECAPLVSISLWHSLASEVTRQTLFERHGQLRKAWRAASKRYDAGDSTIQIRLRFERSWLPNMVVDFINRMYDHQSPDQASLTYCERFLEFLTDLESQLPTRRYVHTFLLDFNLLSLIKLSPMYNFEQNGLFRDILALFQHFMQFPIDDHLGAPLSRDKIYEVYHSSLALLQRVSLKQYKSKLTLLALSNYGAIAKRSDLAIHFSQLTDPELEGLATELALRTSYPPTVSISVNRELLLEILYIRHEKQRTYRESLRHLSSRPTEVDLYDPTLLRNEVFNGSHSLAIPKLNLQYLTVGDFLWRSFVLYRCESFFEIRKDMENTLKRLRPRYGNTAKQITFDGFSRMALPISKPGVIEVAPPKVGFDQPAYVRAEIALDVSSLADNVRREWESLHTGDVIFLVAVQPLDDANGLSNGDSRLPSAKSSGIIHLRTAEIVQLLDENGRMIRENFSGQTNGYGYKPRTRRALVNLDSLAYQADAEAKGKGRPDVYEQINLIVRRRSRENNFKAVLESIKHLATSEASLPPWLQEVFLGYGDPSGARFTSIANRLSRVDLRDTFLNWQHLVESLPGKTIEPDDGQSSTMDPPYVIHTPMQSSAPLPPSSKKRRKDESDNSSAPIESIKVSTYKPANNGPYIEDAPKLNRTRFTPKQVEAILSGIQPGLTIIVGPPGTGKTDVATQIINNIYHDFPTQRTLLIAHSNQALNQLFQKIMELDIDQRHLLRLGHGEEDLETDVSYGKQGRVESFLDNRARLLPEVNRLAETLGAPGAHGNSCETAGYFQSVYIAPTWAKFWDAAAPDSTTASEVPAAFPYHRYFSNAPQPLFPPNASKDNMLDIARGCERHIARIFTELEDIRPFEILRNARDKANYLLVKEARIIAMTSTHAAMRRQEIADLGFHYDNVVMEEAAQITEIETFIPLALQHPRRTQNGDETLPTSAATLPLQRVVLCGDHLQNSPIVQNLAFRQFAHLEQSLFQRLVRLGVPAIHLDAQGRARSSLADLYRWRYTALGDLPHVLSSPEYTIANAGFRYEYQFIDVPDYKGRGEMQPSPHFIQNLGEAEYAVALYQYMRLLGYPREKITILTPYAGQKALIRDVLEHRCRGRAVFGLPRGVFTVDKYQGEQNDYIILSLTRTTRPGYLRDIRRLTVALSRARLGLYILGRRSVFENCWELKDAFLRLLDRSNTLEIVTSETFPTARRVKEELNASVDAGATAVGERSVVRMEGVEHLGKYVFEMTKAVVESRTDGGGDAGEAATDGKDEEVGGDPVEQVDDRDVDEIDMEDGEGAQVEATRVEEDYVT